MSLRSMAWVAACALVVAPVAARATVVEAQSFEEMARLTPVIVRGVVGAQQARWNDEGNRIHTYTEIQVTETLKGDVPKILLVRQPGGEVGPIGARVAGTAKFETGEEVVLFLEIPPDDGTVFIVRGLAAGKIRLAKSGTGEVRATRDLRGLALYHRGEQAPVREVDEVEDLGSAEQFLKRIRHAVRATKGGAK